MEENKDFGVSRSPTKEEERVRLVPVIKEFRQTIDALIQRVPRSYNSPVAGAICPHAFEALEPQANVRYHLTSAKMWAGKILEALDNPFPEELADKAKMD
jgi:hypothetical protein